MMGRQQSDSFGLVCGLCWTASLLIFILLLRPEGTFRFVNGGEDELNALIEAKRQDVRQLATEVERLYGERCSGTTMQTCAKQNFDECLSRLTKATCPGGPVFDAACGDGTACGIHFDYHHSTVRLPPDVSLQDPKIIEDICFSLKLDEFLITKQKEQQQRPTSNVDLPQMYFASVDGVFRIYPARQYQTCRTFDPRVRPWYVAGSSGPKDIVMILDTSGFMLNRGRLNIMKQAAKTVLNTLTVGDRVAIVSFNDDATLAGNHSKLIQTKSQNRLMLSQAIDQLQAGGGNNIDAAFRLAFDTFDLSIDREFNSGCNAAILLFTDDTLKPRDDTAEQSILNLISNRRKAIEDQIQRKLAIFTYSIDADQHYLAKKIACQNDGIWSKIEDELNLVAQMSSYYKYFAIGLGTDFNSGFSAWVEPYSYASGGWNGTTISVPVYDRSLLPHRFFGVVGVDFTLKAMDEALGEFGTAAGGSQRTLDAIVRQSTARCPIIQLEHCDLESIRFQGGGEDAMCFAETKVDDVVCKPSDFVNVETEACPVPNSSYPKPPMIFANNDNEGKSYQDRACCPVNSLTNNQCPTQPTTATSGGGGMTKGGVIGVIFAVIAAIILLVIATLYYFLCRKKPIPNKIIESEDNELPTTDREEAIIPTSASSSLPPPPIPLQMQPLPEDPDNLPVVKERRRIPAAVLPPMDTSDDDDESTSAPTTV